LIKNQIIDILSMLCKLMRMSRINLKNEMWNKINSNYL
jgi:hypothetical protein